MKKINIGDNNKIENNNFGTQVNTENRNFIKKHPILISFLISILSGFILLFNFWDNFALYIEGIFK